VSVLPPLGDFYIKNYNGVAWRLTAGPGTKVIPAQNDGPFLAYPVPGQFFAEVGEALWRGPCGHGWDSFHVFRDFDSATHKSVAVVCCPVCSVTLHYIEPYEEWTNVNSFPIIVG
jgi:hypothetical protein